MKILLNFSNELTKSINNNSLNLISIQINNWTNPIQEHKNKLEKIYQNFLKSQELSKVLFNKWMGPLTIELSNLVIQEVLKLKIIVLLKKMN